ncbi:MAG TPA: hypothetical protein VHX88_10395 [Solirubrobacteraceae bacterium]|jgi:hypothetical protein|nr:hypothetical protein [Solirubrobacteraceae bacterium]
MTPHEDLDRFMDEFGARLHLAAEGQRGAALRWPGVRPPAVRRPAAVALAGGAVASGAAAALLLAARGGPLDVVARADAALAPSGQIAHIALTTWIAPESGGSASPPTTTEEWSTADPQRWRVAQELPPGASGDASGPIVGLEEFAYADGVQSTYIAQRNTLKEVTGVTDEEPPPGFVLTQLQSMLADGELADAGTMQVGGRTVRELTGHSPTWGGSTVTYQVDPSTFAPISGSVTFLWNGGAPLWKGGPVRSATIDFSVGSYQLLPDTAANERLLSIPTSSSPTVTTTTQAQQDAQGSAP